MNDGIYVKVVIESEKNPDLKDIPSESMSCEFKDDSFTFVVNHPKTGDQYKLYIQKKREEIIPDKCKYYIRKN